MRGRPGVNTNRRRSQRPRPCDPRSPLTRLRGYLTGQTDGSTELRHIAAPRAQKETRSSALKSLPNILYTDGNGFTHWRDGKRVSSAYMQGDVRTAGKALTAGNVLLDLFSSFYDWRPIEPTKPRQLAETAARLCRLLRAQVVRAGAVKQSRSRKRAISSAVEHSLHTGGAASSIPANRRGFRVGRSPRNFGRLARRVAVCEPNSDRSPAFCA